MEKDESRFYADLGIPKEIITKRLASRSVLDMPAALRAIKTIHGDNDPRGVKTFQESPEEANERLKNQRKNAFSMRYLESLITESFIDAYDAKKLESRIKIRPEIVEKIIGWTADSPFRSDEKDGKRAYYLAGPSGIGKSSLMQAHAIKLYDNASSADRLKGNAVKYISLSEFFTKFYSSKEDHVKTDLEYNFTHCKYLFIDDIGAEKFSEGKEDTLKNILQRRMESEPNDKSKWTFFSSNYEIDHLPYGQMIIRRIKDLAREVKVGHTYEAKQKFNLNSNFSNS